MGEDPGSELPRVLKPVQASRPSSIFLKSGGLLLVAVLLGYGIARFFGWAAFERFEPDELYDRARTGRIETRKMALAEWGRILQEAEARRRPDDVERFRPTSSQVEGLSVEWPKGDACREADAGAVGASLAVAGFAREPAEARARIRTFLAALPTNDCVEIRASALVSYVRLAPFDAADVALLVPLAGESDPAIRKLVVFALGHGAPTDAQARTIVETALRDTESDVKWNAALALVERPGAPDEAIKIVGDLLVHVKLLPASLTPDEVILYGQVVRTAAHAARPEWTRIVTEISNEHPNLQLRQAAKAALH